MMKQRLLSWLPDPLLAVLGRTRRLVRPTVADVERERRDRIDRALGYPQEVAQGPFAGMRIKRWFFGRWLRQLLGTYENEVWPAVERLCDLKPDLIVNIGAANGYYAVGLARRLETARVLAYEADPALRRILRRTVSANRVDGRVEIHGLCRPSELQDVLALARTTAVVCDCDGCEDLLLDPEKVPRLTTTAVLVELHDHLAPGVSDRIRQRFDSTHHIDVFSIGARTPVHLPPNFALGVEDGLFAMQEYRKITDAQVWWMVPRGMAIGGEDPESSGAR